MSVYFTIPWNTGKNIGEAYNRFMKLLPKDDDFACFIDGDAMFLDSFFGKQIEEVIRANPKCGLFTARTNRVKAKRQVYGDWGNDDIKYHRNVARDLWWTHGTAVEDISDFSKGSLSGVVILIRKSTWKKLGGFSNGLLGVDNDIHRKASIRKQKVCLMKGIYVYHWYRGGDTEDKSHLVQKPLKKIIYSAITGSYDQAIPHNLPHGWEYRLYADPGTPGATHYVKDESLSPVKLARKIKILPWEFFDFDICVWIDGNTVFDREKIEELCEHDFVISKHPERDCIYDEADAILKFGKDTPKMINGLKKRYRAERMPRHAGMVASHAIIRKNTKENRKFCEAWWKEVEKYSHRDQMSFNYVLWKKPIGIHYIPFRTVFRTTKIHRDRIKLST